MSSPAHGVPRHGAPEGRPGAGGARTRTTVLIVAGAAVQVALWVAFDRGAIGATTFATLLLLWGWYVSLVALFGGSLASHVKVMLDEGASAEEAERRHVARPDAG